MADPPTSKDVHSPISTLLKGMGLTRDDLQRHAAQMRDFLGAEDKNSLRAFSQQPSSQESSTAETHHRRRSSSGTTPNTAANRRSLSPPKTPVKTEPVESRVPPRNMDTMEMVMERKSRQKKKDRRVSGSHSREERRVSHRKHHSPSRSETPHAFFFRAIYQYTPETPHHYRYYSERVIGSASSSHINHDPYSDHGLVPKTPSRHGSTSAKPRATQLGLPATPVGRHIYSLNRPGSSRASTPLSSPTKVVNLVSSPGPMRAGPPADDLDDLPFTIPPGPYSHVKPDYSYAAMIGQAILASPQHRLALQDIYEYITTVYPYYKRGEQTWMNSVRHALSTMAVFRKVPRARMEGKSLWAVYDCDLPCFANGGFRKSLCADMVKNKEPPGKPGPKKRGALDDTLSSRNKRRKKMEDLPDSAATSVQPFPPMLSAPMLPPFYQPHITGTHHQPYYQSYIPQPAVPQPQTLPAEVIFPPLPPSSVYHRLTTMVSASSSSRPATAEPSSEPSHYPVKRESSILREQSLPPSSSDIPDLAHNLSSSSSPPLSSGGDEGSAPTKSHVASADDEFEEWLAADPVSDLDALPPSFTLLDSAKSKSSSRKAPMQPPSAGRRNHSMSLLPLPVSPTMERRSAAKQKQKAAVPRTPSPSPSSRRSRHSPAVTPSLIDPSSLPVRPCTPPRKRKDSGSQLSPIRTPISHRGLHMSPSPSLAHYKTNLDPPPPMPFRAQAPLLCNFTSSDAALSLPNPDVLKTPSRRRTSAPFGSAPGSGSGGIFPFTFTLSPFAPVTPKKLQFPSSSSDSPFRTPSRQIHDPHDPSNILDDEISRMGPIGHEAHSFMDSPAGGLFGTHKSGLYASPGFSPSAFDKF